MDTEDLEEIFALRQVLVDAVARVDAVLAQHGVEVVPREKVPTGVLLEERHLKHEAHVRARQGGGG